jgi:hypothetical protein
MIKKGDMIENYNGHWCNNPNCPNPPTAKSKESEKTPTPTTEKTYPVPDPLVATQAFIDLMNKNKITDSEMWHACAKVWNTVTMQN